MHRTILCFLERPASRRRRPAAAGDGCHRWVDLPSTSASRCREAVGLGWVTVRRSEWEPAEDRLAAPEFVSPRLMHSVSITVNELLTVGT